jgi:hypothetical protein
MRFPRFSLATLFVAMSVTGLVLWTNIRESIVISNSPTALGLTGLVSIRIRSGWPFSHSATSFLVQRDRADEFVRNWPISGEGGKPPQFMSQRLVANVLVGGVLIALAAAVCEIVMRRVRRG